MTQAYLYRWTEIATSKWYVGSRYAKGCHPDDGYICSSKVVKPLIISNPSGWTREVLVIGNSTDIRELESKYLTALDAAKSTQSYNKRNGSGSFHTVGMPISEKQMRFLKENNPSWREDVKEKLRIKGKSRDVSHLHDPKHKEKVVLGHKRAWAEGKYVGVGFKSGDENVAKSDAVKVKLSQTRKQRKIQPMTGKTHSDETKKKMAEIRAIYWANKKAADAGKNYTV
jgi:hypothetical protein